MDLKERILTSAKNFGLDDLSFEALETMYYDPSEVEFRWHVDNMKGN